MEIFIIIAFSMAIWHFTYESLIAPNLRLKMRHDLFIERDKLYNIKISEDTKAVDKAAIDIIDQNIKFMKVRMSEITIHSLMQFKKLYESDEKLRSKIDNIELKISSSENSDIKSIDKKLNRIATNALLINSGGWLVYLLPFAILKAMLSDLINGIKQISREITIIPNYQFDNMQSKRFA